jgi:protein phosphatase
MNTDRRIHLKVEAPGIVITGISDTGRKRSENQDAIYLDEKGKFLLLADGMGGHERGSEASSTALEVIQEFFQPDVLEAELADITEGSGIPAEILVLQSLADEAVTKANTVLYERNREAQLKRFMGTTVVGIFFTDDGHAMWFHVGDSRIYRYRDSELKCLTVDHSAYNKWVRDGRQGKEPATNIITRAIGPMIGVSADSLWEKREPGDTYMLCCDGLTDLVSDEEIAKIMGDAPDVDEMAVQLVEAALEAGGKDNTSVIVCSV